MEQFNRVELQGVVGGVRQMNFQGTPLTRISLATNYAYKDRDGMAVIDTSWHNITAWQGRGIPDLSNLEKGSRLHVMGRIRYQKYTGADGTDRYFTDILATQIEILPDKESFQYEMV